VEMQCHYFDLYSLFQNEGKSDLLASDGLHPNAKGHSLMYEFILGKLNR